MHIPDGFLSPPVWIGLDLVSAVGIAIASRVAGRRLDDRTIPLMGVGGAFVFAAQAVNFPVAAGTSGHLVGGALLVALLGPAAASLVLACVVTVQCLLFQDGGITAIGANVFNMALAGPWTAAAVLAAARPLSRRAGERSWPLFLAAWLSVVVAALLAAVELALSGSAPLLPALVAMGSVHALIGAGEGAITVAVVRFLAAVRPGLA